MALPDYVERRIVIEYGRQYVYVYMTDGGGKLIRDREESFRQPILLDRRDAIEEATETWDLVYQHVNETVNFPLPEAGDDESESDTEEN